MGMRARLGLGIGGDLKQQMMGMRARLGLGMGRDLKQQMNKTLSTIRYRSSNTAAASEKKKEEEKSLYLYFKVHFLQEGRKQVHHERFPVRSVKLSYLLSPSPATKTDIDDDPNVSDQVLPDLRRSKRERDWAQISSHYLFTAPVPVGGSPSFSRSYASHSCSLRKSKAKEVNKNFPVIKRMRRHGDEVLYLEGELPGDGKLYCLSPSTIYYLKEAEAFQVFDTKSKKWLSLQTPPMTVPRDSLGFSSVVVGNKVLVWYANDPGVFCYDVTQPEKGWSPAAPSLGNCIPFIDCRLPLVIQHENNNFLLFNFDPTTDHHSINVFLISTHPCVTLQPLKQSLQLPEVPDIPPDFFMQCEYHLVHLGGQKICLVFHSFQYPLDYGDIPGCRDMSLPQLAEIASRGRNKGNIVLITFEYEMKLESLDIEYRVLTTRNLQYTGMRDPKGIYPITTTLAMLSGASVL